MAIIELGESKFDAKQMLFEIERANAEDSLSEFIKQAWHIVEPGQPYIHNWHVDLICEHLEAITEGEILPDGTPYNRLLINVPPGMMKSLILNVFWPAWEWGPRNMPHLRYICAAHQQNLAVRDSTKMRRLVISDWYQKRWGDRVQLTKDQNMKTKFENTSTGFREAVAAGSITGARGDRVLIDDPHSVEGANSDQMRASTIEWFLEAVPTRLNNPRESAIVVIMQRLHEEDVSGIILNKNLGYDHIMLPMMYDPARAAPTKLGIEDPREEEGELLFPARFPQEVVERDSKVMGPYAFAGQMQQSPEPRGGGIIKRDWWQVWEESAYPPMDYVVASLDTAYTTKQENDFSAMTVWGVFTGSTTATIKEQKTFDGDWPTINSVIEREYEQRNPSVMLMSAWQEKLPLHELVEKVASTCRRMGVDKLLIEDKAAGHSVAQEIQRLYGHEDWMVQLINPGAIDKMARLYSIQHLFAEGMIHAPDRQWADAVINQCATFPRAKHDDLCLVSGTQITMADGSQKPIELVTEGDYVATPNGARRVTASAFTGIKPIWRLEHQLGSLEGTGNHPVWASGCWVELEKLCPNDTLTMYQQETQSSWRSKEKKGWLSRRWSSMGIGIIDILTPAILRTADILRGQVIVSTGTFGSTTMAPFQRGIKSITLMGIRGTTTSQTLSASPSNSTALNIAPNMSREGNLKSSWSIFGAFRRKPKSGTPARLGANGTARTPLNPCSRRVRQSLTAKAATLVNVAGAAIPLLQKALKRFSVRQDVQKKRVSTSEVFSVKFTHTMRPVFNLTVEGEHCYYANGVLTHNCDTVSMGLRHMREIGLLARAPEIRADIQDEMRHTGGPLPPLYPV